MALQAVAVGALLLVGGLIVLMAESHTTREHGTIVLVLAVIALIWGGL